MNKQKFRAIYIEAGFTQKTLAKAVNMGENTLNAKINGKSKLNIDEVCLLCNALNITSDTQKCKIFLS